MTGSLYLSDGRVRGTAVGSNCNGYRFRLGRTWGPGPRVCFVMLNPSTADGGTDDPTIRRCGAFADGWGYDGFDVVNLYAQRATDPADLYRDLRIGVGNDDHVLAVAKAADLVVVAWGAFAGAPGAAAWNVAQQARRVTAMLVEAGVRLFALSTTASGWPGHPLYLAGDLAPKPWSPPTPGKATRTKPLLGPTEAEVVAGHAYVTNDAGRPRGSGMTMVPFPEQDAAQARIALAARGLREVLRGSRTDLHDQARARLDELADLSRNLDPDPDGFRAVDQESP